MTLIGTSWIGKSCRFLVVVLGLGLSACAYPGSSVSQGGNDTALYFSSVPENAHVFVDGVDAGPAEGLDGAMAALRVTPGRHLVELRIGNTSVFKTELFLDDGVTMKVNVE